MAPRKTSSRKKDTIPEDAVKKVAVKRGKKVVAANDVENDEIPTKKGKLEIDEDATANTLVAASIPNISDAVVMKTTKKKATPKKRAKASKAGSATVVANIEGADTNGTETKGEEIALKSSPVKKESTKTTKRATPKKRAKASKADSATVVVANIVSADTNGSETNELTKTTKKATPKKRAKTSNKDAQTNGEAKSPALPLRRAPVKKASTKVVAETIVETVAVVAEETTITKKTLKKRVPLKKPTPEVIPEVAPKSPPMKRGATKSASVKVVEDDAEVDASPVKGNKKQNTTVKKVLPGARKRGAAKKVVAEAEDDADGNVITSAKPSKAPKRKAAAAAKSSPVAKRPANDLVRTPEVVVSSNELADQTFDCSRGSLDLGEKRYNLKITSWNVAGLRALAKKGGLSFIEQHKPDIFCMQEIKCLSDEVPSEAKINGYHYYWNSAPGGRAGVALYTKVMPFHVEYGLGDEELDSEGRLITADYTKFYLICVYVPNSGRKLVTLPKRMRWNALFLEHVRKHSEKKPVIVCGDMNVSHLEIDLANPKANKRNAGFTVEERDDMTKLLAAGYVDTFRMLYPEQQNAYTYWTYMANARVRNIGWRLDYFIVSDRIKDKVVDNVIKSEVLGSDHCPITLYLNI